MPCIFSGKSCIFTAFLPWFPYDLYYANRCRAKLATWKPTYEYWTLFVRPYESKSSKIQACEPNWDYPAPGKTTPTGESKAEKYYPKCAPSEAGLCVLKTARMRSISQIILTTTTQQGNYYSTSRAKTAPNISNYYKFIIFPPVTYPK